VGSVAVPPVNYEENAHGATAAGLKCRPDGFSRITVMARASLKGAIVKEKVRALVIKARHDPLDILRMALEEQSIDIYCARNCAEAALAMLSNSPPHLVFTDIHLSDGDWEDVLTLAGKSSEPINVIVVAPYVDIGFYVQVIERGAFDFIVPPLSDPEFMHVVRIAAENALNRREKHASVFPGSILVASAPKAGEKERAVARAED